MKATFGGNGMSWTTLLGIPYCMDMWLTLFVYLTLNLQGHPDIIIRVPPTRVNILLVASPRYLHFLFILRVCLAQLQEFGMRTSLRLYWYKINVRVMKEKRNSSASILNFFCLSSFSMKVD